MKRFVTVSRPWVAHVQVDSPEPARYLASMSLQSLNYGMPALRTGGIALAALGRREVSVGPAAWVVRHLPRVDLPEVEALVDRVRERWPELAAASDGLPATPPRLSVLTMERTSGRFVFVFGGGPTPLLLIKPAPAAGQSDPETRALHLVEGLGLAPRPLPSVTGLVLQEGLPGRPLRVLPTGRRGWSAPYVGPFDELGEALVRVAARTARPGRPPALDHLDLALSHTREETRRRVEQAREELRDHDGVCLEHHDLNAQNWLVHDGRFSGLVDWEASVETGLPGYDAIHTALALLEHGVALRRWTQAEVLGEFARAWATEPLFVRARHWHRECVRAATGSTALAEPLLLTYFASRLARKLVGGGPALVEVRTAERMLDLVAAGGQRSTEDA